MLCEEQHVRNGKNVVMISVEQKLLHDRRALPILVTSAGLCKPFYVLSIGTGTPRKLGGPSPQ